MTPEQEIVADGLSMMRQQTYQFATIWPIMRATSFDILARLVNEAWAFCALLIETVSRVEAYVEREGLLEDKS